MCSRASLQPEQTAYIFLPDEETESGKLTYQELDRQARAIASKIQTKLEPGDRALVIYPYHAGLEFIAAFFGCLYVGVIAVTSNPPRNQKAIAQLQERAVSSQVKAVLTTEEFLSQFQTELGQNFLVDRQFQQLALLATDKIASSLANDWSVPELTSNTIAFFQHTSGSTGVPKEVMETLECFTAAFASCGFQKEAFYPCYGMAEATLFVSGGDRAKLPVVKYVDRSALESNRVVEVNREHPKAKAIVGCGKTWLEQKIIIVDPATSIPYAGDRVGEIWVSGSGIGKGYWNQPQATQETFTAYLADTNEGSFLRTGDLGFIADGELYITGRLKDVMIFWGVYQYPHHIERTVQKSHPALRLNCGAAFAVEVGEKERLVIAQEVERNYLRKLNVQEIVETINKTVITEHKVDVYAIVLLKTGSIPKTSSGKIQRRACRKMFLENSLEVVGQWQQSPEQQDDVTAIFS